MITLCGNTFTRTAFQFGSELPSSKSKMKMGLGVGVGKLEGWEDLFYLLDGMLPDS